MRAKKNAVNGTNADGGGGSQKGTGEPLTLPNLPQPMSDSQAHKPERISFLSRDFYDTREMAELLGETRETVRGLCEAGVIPDAIKTGDGMMSRWYCPRRSFDRWLRERSAGAPASPIDVDQLAAKVAERLGDRLQIVVGTRLRGGA